MGSRWERRSREKAERRKRKGRGQKDAGCRGTSQPCMQQTGERATGKKQTRVSRSLAGERGDGDCTEDRRKRATEMGGEESARPMLSGTHRRGRDGR